MLRRDEYHAGRYQQISSLQGLIESCGRGMTTPYVISEGSRRTFLLAGLLAPGGGRERLEAVRIPHELGSNIRMPQRRTEQRARASGPSISKDASNFYPLCVY